MTITTNKKYNFDKAENDTFSWSMFDGTRGKQLCHKASGRSIYQMQYIDPKTGYVSESVDEETRQAAIAFWDELQNLQNQKPAREAVGESVRGSGWCDRCRSYCYGDCTAND